MPSLLARAITAANELWNQLDGLVRAEQLMLQFVSQLPRHDQCGAGLKICAISTLYSIRGVDVSAAAKHFSSTLEGTRTDPDPELVTRLADVGSGRLELSLASKYVYFHWPSASLPIKDRWVLGALRKHYPDVNLEDRDYPALCSAFDRINHDAGQLFDTQARDKYLWIQGQLIALARGTTREQKVNSLVKERVEDATSRSVLSVIKAGLPPLMQ